MYKKANLTVSHFDVEDVITTSGVEQPDAPQPMPSNPDGESADLPV